MSEPVAALLDGLGLSRRTRIFAAGANPLGEEPYAALQRMGGCDPEIDLQGGAVEVLTGGARAWRQAMPSCHLDALRTELRRF